VPAGSEFQINTYTFGNQSYPNLSTDAEGDFVVVWHSRPHQDGDYDGVFGQRYDSSGTALGSEFLVNTTTLGLQLFSGIAAEADGSFVVVWEHRSSQAAHADVFGQRFDSDGLPLGTEFMSNTYTVHQQKFPGVASDADGDFVVVWTSRNQDGDHYGIFGQRYSSDGNPAGTEFQVNAYTVSWQEFSSVASHADGAFVAVWATLGRDGSTWGVGGQRFDSAGARLGSEFLVNSYTIGDQRMPAVATDPDGGFVVAWQSYGQDGSAEGVFAQRFDENANKLGTELLVNTYTTSAQSRPSITTDADGKFVIVWRSTPQDGDGDGIFGRHFDATGTPLSAEFQVNTYTMRNQSNFARIVSAAPAGDFVVVWHSSYQDRSGNGAFGQRFHLE
jgi:hypothetical protein